MGLFRFLSPVARPKTRVKAAQESRLLVVPVDDSQHSLQALEWAVNNVYNAQRQDQLHILSVVPRTPGPYPAEVREQDGRASLLLLCWQRCDLGQPVT